MSKLYLNNQKKNQGISNFEDEIIRGTFKKYDKGMSTIIDGDFKTRKPSNCDCEIFCGWFVARIYVGNNCVGKYKFDCTEYDVPFFKGPEEIHVTKL